MVLFAGVVIGRLITGLQNNGPVRDLTSQSDSQPETERLKLFRQELFAAKLRICSRLRFLTEPTAAAGEDLD